MALKALTKVKVSESAPSKKSDTKVVPFAGVAITEFIVLKREVEEREARMAALELEIKEAGTASIIGINCANPTNPVSSVKLTDENVPPAQAIVAFTSKYSVVDGEAVSAAFDSINERRAAANPTAPALDVNEYAQFMAVMKVKPEAFYDKDGNFQETVYAEIRKAIDAATVKLVAAGKIASDTKFYTEEQKAMVKPDFHAKRWALSVEENTSLLGVVKNTVSLRAVVA